MSVQLVLYFGSRLPAPGADNFVWTVAAKLGHVAPEAQLQALRQAQAALPVGLVDGPAGPAETTAEDDYGQRLVFLPPEAVLAALTADLTDSAGPMVEHRHEAAIVRALLHQVTTNPAEWAWGTGVVLYGQ